MTVRYPLHEKVGSVPPHDVHSAAARMARAIAGAWLIAILSFACSATNEVPVEEAVDMSRIVLTVKDQPHDKVMSYPIFRRWVYRAARKDQAVQDPEIEAFLAEMLVVSGNGRIPFEEGDLEGRLQQLLMRIQPR